MPLSESPTIEVKDLKTYFFTKGGIAKAVDGVSFSVGRGKVLGLVGESGSGKTLSALSILKLLPGNGNIISGSIVFKEKD